MIGNVKGNPNHGGLNLYVRHDLDQEEKEEEERKNANTNLNNYINEYKDDKENTQITNPRCWEHGCKTVTFLIELGDPIDNFIEAKIGHATVSVGQNFYDFGPVRRSMGGWRLLLGRSNLQPLGRKMGCESQSNTKRCKTKHQKACNGSCCRRSNYMRLQEAC